MEKFTTLEGVAAPLKVVNVDTDMIIPKQYLKTIKRTGLGKGLFSEKRYRDDGSENPDFVLNKPAYRKAKILVAGDNFGCGSSREHAPWALLDFGIRCVISTSFGDIFYNNCFKNGILPIRVSPEDLDKLFDDADRGANATLTVDLEKQEIRGPDGGTVKFEIDAVPQALPAQRPRRYRADDGEEGQDRRLREQDQGGAPVALRALLLGGLAAVFVSAPAEAQRTRSTDCGNASAMPACKFRRHNPQFRRFLIDRATVETDRYADQIGTQFVSTDLSRQGHLRSRSRSADRALHLPAWRLSARRAVRLHARRSSAPSARARKREPDPAADQERPAHARDQSYARARQQACRARPVSTA